MPDSGRTPGDPQASTLDRPSLGELHRNMFALRGELSETRAQLAKLHELAIAQAIAKAELTDHERRLDGIDGTLRWVVRTVFASLILAVLGLVVGGVQL